MNESRVAQLFSRAKLERVELVGRPYPEQLHIELAALEKIRSICKLVKKHHGSREWYGFLIARAGALDVITDVLLEENDDNSGAHTSITPAAIAQAAARSEALGCRIVGWVHSHATMEVFFSRTDRENISLVLSSVSLNTRVLAAREQLADEVKLIPAGTAPDAGVGLCMQVGVEAAKSARLEVPVYCGWSYNVVVNDQDDLYAEVAIVEENPWTRRESLACKILRLDVRESEAVVDLEALSEEVRTKIRAGYRWGWGSSWSNAWNGNGNGNGSRRIDAPERRERTARDDRLEFLESSMRTHMRKLLAAGYTLREIREVVEDYHEHEA